MVKKFFALFLALAVVAVSAVTANAVMELTQIDAPYGIMYKVYDDGVSERVSVSCLFTDEYAALTGLTNEESMVKYGIMNVSAYVQIDYRIDGSEWQADSAWDTTFDAARYGGSIPAGDTVRTFDLLYLVNDSDAKIAGELAVEDKDGKRVFDLDNHTLEFRMRSVLSYSDVQSQIIVSEWSEAVKVERNKDFGKAPEKLEAPNLYNAQIAYDEKEMPYLTFDIKTPESIKKAEAWLSTQVPTYISLLVEIDKGTGAWESANLSGTVGPYVNETKNIYLNIADLADASHMRVRVRYVAYLADATIYSDYSEVMEYSVPRWEEGKGVLHAKCQVCGMCKPIFGQCVFVVGGIALVAVVIAAVPVKMYVDKKKAKKAAEEEEKQRKLKEEREAYNKAKQNKKNKNKKG